MSNPVKMSRKPKRIRYNSSCPTCRKYFSPVEVEQTRKGGEFRIWLEGRVVAHATRKRDAEEVARLLRKGQDADV